MNATTLTVQVKDGAFTAHVAMPGSARAPGLLLAQEIFGVNADMRSIARSYADRGYLTVVPDLFWRISPGIELDPEVDLAAGLELYGKFDQDTAVEDLKATLQTVRDLPSCSGEVGCLGFCLGGKLAYLMATRSDSDATVGYYGVGIERSLEESASIKKPVMLHLGEADPYVPPPAQQAIRDALAGNRLATVYSYPRCDHAFARVGGAHYDPHAADLANRRTNEFFMKHLPSG